jgi:hypothetical protein
MRTHTTTTIQPHGLADPILTLAGQNDDAPRSILEIIYRGIVFSANDFGANQMDAFRYATTAGWDDDSYAELKQKFGWTDDDVQALKELQEKFIELERKYWR